MHNLGGIAWRSLRRRPLRSALTMAGIALGVGLLFAALAVNAGVDAAVQRTVAETAGHADLTVQAFAPQGLSMEAQRAVASLAGVQAVAPSVQRRTFATGPAEGSLGPVLMVGVDPDTDRQLHDDPLLAGTSLHAGDDADVLVTDAWAAEHGVRLGSRLSFVGSAGIRKFIVSGIVGPGGRAVEEGGSVVFVTMPAAQALFGLGANVDQLDVAVDPGVGVPAVAAAIQRSLTAEPYVLSTTKDRLDSLEASTRDFRSTTILIAAVALFVGGFLIFNTLSMTIAERAREVGLLRAVGATPRQVDRLFLREAAALGALGSLAGCAVGVGLALAMAAWVRGVDGIPSGDPSLTPAPFVLALVVGMGVTLAAALEPAWRASRISPVDALRSRAAPSGVGRPRLRWLALVAGVLALTAVLLWRGADPAASLRPLVVFALLLGGALLAPFALDVLARLAGFVFARSLRAEGRLARSAVVRDRGRTAVTLGALAIGLAMVVAVAMVAQNARSAGAAWLAEALPGDYVATAVTPVPADFANDLAAVRGVASVTPVRQFDLDVSGHRVDAVAIDPEAFGRAGALRIVGADRGAAFAALQAGGACLVPASLSTELGAAVGGDIRIRTSTGDQACRVAGLAERTLPGASGESIVVSLADARSRFGADGATLFAVTAAADAPRTLRADLTDVASRYALQVLDRGQISGAVGRSLDRVFGLFDAIALVAVVVAALGIVNTLTMDVYERVREIGVLRAAGMTRRQVWRMVVLEAILLGVAGAAMGILAGVAVGSGMLLAARSSDFRPPLEIPWPTLAAVAVLGVAISALAAAYPARLASRVAIVRAVRFE